MRIQIDDHLYLSPLTKADLEVIVRKINDITIYENTLQVPYPYTSADGKKFIEHCLEFQLKNKKVKDFAIRNASGELIGGIGVMYNHGMDSHKSEFGYWLASDERNKGIMSRVINVFSEISFTQFGLVRLEAHVFPDNVASQRVLEKAGFTYEGYLQKAMKKNDQYLDVKLYAKIAKTS